ncbi:MAG: tRNA (adenosine(37)-N6)-threonylcarbamoyltransferase complex transferase subunit TsaD, partial [Oscillospiraceae bacterium]|nr:tRNA (adenosine(37)-N6)-threonylcarbamoyltransferase complex transferase subunit TsaD [Oscillospiraceae bacterium]
RPKLDSPYDMSFSGIKTAVVNLVSNERQRGGDICADDLAASFQHTVCGILTAKFFAAAKDLGYKKLACAGGVCANSGLRGMLEAEAAELGARLFIPPLPLCGDNAAMIGAQAYREYMAGNIAGMNLNAYASLQI